MLQLYIVPGCPFGHRAVIALREKQLAFEISFFDAERRPPELQALGPLGRSPTLFDGDAAVAESMVVLEYLEDRYPEPRLMPASARGRAAVRTAIAWFHEQIQPSIHAYVMEVFFRAGRDPGLVAQSAAHVREKLGLLDGVLRERAFVAGEAFGLADIALYPLFPCMKALGGLDIPARLGHARAWAERVGARPSAPLPLPEGRSWPPATPPTTF